MNLSDAVSNLLRGHAGRLALLYAAISTLWVVIASHLIHRELQGATAEAPLHAALGVLFVAITALILYRLSQRRERELGAARIQLQLALLQQRRLAQKLQRQLAALDETSDT